jgi:hypothetical protein
MIQTLLCKLNIRHKWHVEHAEDGSRYVRCRHCGKDNDERSQGIHGDIGGPTVGGG